MQKELGSRGYSTIDYYGVCTLSGVNSNLPCHCFNNDCLILRKDLVSYCYEYLSYKIGITVNNVDITLNWTKDLERYPTKVFRDTIENDYKCTLQILNIFEQNFLKSDAKKTLY